MTTSLIRNLTTLPRLAAWWLLQGFLESLPAPLMTVRSNNFFGSYLASYFPFFLSPSFLLRVRTKLFLDRSFFDSFFLSREEQRGGVPWWKACRGLPPRPRLRRVLPPPHHWHRQQGWLEVHRRVLLLHHHRNHHPRLHRQQCSIVHHPHHSQLLQAWVQLLQAG